MKHIFDNNINKNINILWFRTQEIHLIGGEKVFSCFIIIRELIALNIYIKVL